MRTVDLGKSSMGRLCLLGLLSLQSTLTSATTHESSGATGPAVFKFKVEQSHSIRQFKNVDGTANTERLDSHRQQLETKYLRNFESANGEKVIPLFPNTASPLQKRGVSLDFQQTLVAAQEIEANFKAKIKTKGKLDKRAGGARASRVSFEAFMWASSAIYQVPTRIGTPSKVFSITLDTGSGLSWVRSECKAGDEQQCTPGRSRLSLEDSTTLMKSSTNWSTSYASGETSGVFMRDVFQIGSLRYDQQIFASASKISQVLNTVPTDGVLGASFSTIAMAQTPTFLENLIKSQLIEQPVMSFIMKASNSAPHGYLTLGGTDEDVIQPGTLMFHPVTVTAYWQVRAAGLTVGGKVVPGTAMECAVDTGSSINYVPPSVADAFFATISGAVKSQNLGWTVPYESLPVIKTIGFAFSGVSYNIPIASLVVGADPEDPSRCKLAISSGSNKDINGKPVAILGQPFLKHLYTILSYSNNKQPAVGFAAFVGSKVIIDSVDGAALPPAIDPSSPPSDKDVKPKSIALSAQVPDTKQPANKTQTPPTTQTPVHGPSKDAGKLSPYQDGEGGGEPTPGSDPKKGSSPDLPETTRHAAKKVKLPQDTEAGRPDSKETDATKPYGKGVETPVPDGKGTKQHDAGGKSTPAAKEQPGAKDIGPKVGPPVRPPTRSDFHAPEESDSTKDTTTKNPAPKSKTEEDPAPKSKAEKDPAPKSKAEKDPAPKSKAEKDPVPKSKTEKAGPEQSQYPEEHKPAASDKTPEGKGTKKEHDQAAVGKDQDRKPDQQADFGPPTVQQVSRLNISGNGSDSQLGVQGGTNNPNPTLLGNSTLPPDTFQPAQEPHSAAPAILSSVWSSSAVLVLVSTGFLLFGI